MFHTIYITTNKINNKKYIGKHSTPDPNDDYIGSGKLIKNAIRHYGRENFEKEVLYVFDSVESMDAKERELITQEVIESSMYYNLAPGGEGGDVLAYADKSKHIKKSKAISEKLKGKKLTEYHKMRIRETHADISGNKNPMYGKLHNDRTKELIRQKKLNSPKILCRCGKEVDSANFKRWHGENCKI